MKKKCKADGFADNATAIKELRLSPDLGEHGGSHNQTIYVLSRSSKIFFL